MGLKENPDDCLRPLKLVIAIIAFQNKTEQAINHFLHTFIIMGYAAADRSLPSVQKIV